jgi:PAS domain S-box-containing protein
VVSRVEGVEAGADDYLVKPFSARELRARVTAHLEMARVRREANASIRASEERFRTFVRASSDVVYRMSPDWSEMRLIDGRELFPDTDEPSRTWLETYIHPDDRPGVLAVIREAIRTKGVFELEHRVVRVDGTLGWAFSRAIPLLDADGEVVGWFGAASDVTARKRAEEELQEERDRLRVTLASIGDGVITVDTEGRVTFLNGAAEALTGWANADAAGRPLAEVFRIVNEDTRRPVENPAARALTDGVVGLANHTVLVRKDGTERPIDDCAAPVRDGTGRVVGGVLVFRDVAERRRAENVARRSQELLRLVHQIGRIGHWEWNALTDENRWSPEIEALYGLEPGTFGGTYEAWAKLLHPDDLPRAEEDVRRALETGKYFTEFRVIWPDGSVHWLEARANVFKDGHDRPVRITGVNMDVTERKRNEEALKEADRRKDEFLATPAHELRNPLAPLRNALQIMRLSADPQAREQASTMMERQLGQMVRPVDDLMDVNRITRGKMDLRRERVELAAVVSNAVEASRPLVERMGHALTVTLPERPVVLDADLTRLVQVFMNLLNNAAKYTDPGGRIGLSAECRGGEVMVSVRDTGVGIPPDKLQSIFDMFAQVDRSLEKAQGGLGIGLTLVKRLVEMHGGGVEARSGGHGRGSEFVVRLPVPRFSAEQPRNEADNATAPPTAARRILVADDNRDAANSLAMLLRIMGNEAQTAHDGLKALAVGASFKPDVVLLDIGMPKLNGYDTCRRIREQAWGREAVLVACTGWGQDDDRRKAREAGFDLHMVKPIDTTALEKKLATFKTATGKRDAGG